MSSRHSPRNPLLWALRLTGSVVHGEHHFSRREPRGDYLGLPALAVGDGDEGGRERTAASALSMCTSIAAKDSSKRCSACLSDSIAAAIAAW